MCASWDEGSHIEIGGLQSLIEKGRLILQELNELLQLGQIQI